MRWLLPILAACGGSDTSDADDPIALRAVTFNTGTSEGMGHDDPPDDGYGEAQAAISDAWYGDGLAWLPVVADATAFLTDLRPDVIAFQEIFWSGECPGIPAEAREGWVCETWADGDPTVAQTILGPDYQVACNQGKADKCLAVHRDFGRFEGCDRDLCLDFLDGAEIAGCGSGSRVGRGRIALASGGSLTVVGFHGSSGIAADDMACREAQLRLVFEDMDGEPAANGRHNLVLGDFNTDPGRAADFDPSAAALAELSAAAGLSFATDVGPEVEPTYAGVFNIDHVLADTLSGPCTAHRDVTPVRYFDHLPVACDLETR